MAVSFTPSNDLIFPSVDGQTYLGGAGDDTYLLSDNFIKADTTVILQDTEGANKIQLVDGLSIASSKVTSNALQLTLSNGAVVQILGADNFTYDVGGNATTATEGVVQNFTELVEDTLGATVPADGEDPVDGGEVTVGETPAGEFTVVQSASTVEEGGTVTYTITASEAVEADTAFTFSLAGTGSPAAGAADFASATSGTATIAAGETSTTFTVAIAAGDDAEFAEGFAVTVKTASGDDVATLTNSIIDTSTADITAPTVEAGQNYNYAENQEADAVIATVKASDAEGAVASFAITDGDADGYFAINAQGQITLTEAGLAAASNNYEATPNAFELKVTATDEAGNVSEAVVVELEVDDVDDVAPTLSAATLAGDVATLTFDEALGAVAPSASDFTVTVKGSASNVSINQVTIDGSTVQLKLATAPAAGETFQVAYTPGANPLQDVAGNEAAAIAATDIILDTTAPVVTAGQTFSYQEGAYDDTTDVVGTVATNDASVNTYTIESGNAEGYFTIDGNGNITLTAAGLPTSVESNDFETGVNTFTLGISATDGAGNKSATENVTINVTDDAADNLEAPIIANLTVGADPAAGVVLGSNNDDTISGTVSANAGETTLSAIDFINAGDHGTVGDTLNVELRGVGVTAANYNGGATIQNVENLKLTNNGVASTFNTNGVTSFTKVENNSSTVNLTVSNLLNTMTTIDVKNIGATVGQGTYNWAASQLTGAETLTINLDSAGVGGAGVLTVGPGTATTASFGSIAINSGGTAGTNRTTLTTDGVQTSIASLDLNGAQGLTLALAADNIATTATTINASDMTGGLTLSGMGAVNHNITGGSGNDAILFGANFTIADTVNGGTAGTDTLGANGAQLTAVTVANPAALVSNIDTLFIQDDITAAGAAATVDLSLFGSNAANVRIADQAAGAAATDVITVNNLITGGTVRFDGDALAANVMNVKDALNASTNDTMTIDLRGDGAVAAGVADNVIFTMAGVENLNIDTTNATVGKLVNITATSLENVTVTGIQSVDLTQGGNTTLAAGVKTVDASGLTGNAALTVTLNAAATVGGKVTGSANGDTIIGGLLNDDITGGGGIDAITGGAGADDISGGAGNDNFTIAANGNGATAGSTGAAIASGASAANLDVYTDLNAGDTFTFTGGVAIAGSAIGTAIGGANDTVNFIRGTYNTGTDIWTSTGLGTDTLVVFDSDAAATVANEAIVLVGFVDSGASAVAANAGNAVLTLG